MRVDTKIQTAYNRCANCTLACVAGVRRGGRGGDTNERAKRASEKRARCRERDACKDATVFFVFYVLTDVPLPDPRALRTLVSSPRSLVSSPLPPLRPPATKANCTYVYISALLALKHFSHKFKTKLIP